MVTITSTAEAFVPAPGTASPTPHRTHPMRTRLGRVAGVRRCATDSRSAALALGQRVHRLHKILLVESIPGHEFLLRRCPGRLRFVSWLAVRVLSVTSVTSRCVGRSPCSPAFDQRHLIASSSHYARSHVWMRLYRPPCAPGYICASIPLCVFVIVVLSDWNRVQLVFGLLQPFHSSYRHGP
jgi:hypothetical protein